MGCKSDLSAKTCPVGKSVFPRAGESFFPQFRSPEETEARFALGGGFARGLAHVGVLKALEEENITIDYMAGTSVGSVIAAAFSGGVSAKELEEIAKMVRFIAASSRAGRCHATASEQRPHGGISAASREP